MDDKVFDSIMQGLNEALEYERGDLPNVRVDKITVSPLRMYSGEDVKGIRNSINMTQRLFAEALGVSAKTVEAWEAGTNTPSGAARRMLELMSNDRGLLEKNSIITRQ